MPGGSFLSARNLAIPGGRRRELPEREFCARWTTSQGGHGLRRDERVVAIRRRSRHPVGTMPVDLIAFTADRRITGSIPLADDRLSDMLNSVPRVVIRGATVTDLAADAVPRTGDVT